MSIYLHKNSASGGNKFMNLMLTVVLVLIISAQSHAAVIEMEMPNEMQLANAPQTHEELLRRLKSVYDTPDISGPEIVKQVIGFDVVKASNTENGRKEYRRADGQIIRFEKRKIGKTGHFTSNEKTAIERSVAKSESPVISKITYVYYGEDSYYFIIGMREDKDRLRCMTPEITVKILGRPNRAVPKNWEDPSPYRTLAIYEKSTIHSHGRMDLLYAKQFETIKLLADAYKNYSTNKDDCVKSIRIRNNYQ